jgi:hypothetical protein
VGNRGAVRVRGPQITVLAGATHILSTSTSLSDPSLPLHLSHLFLRGGPKVEQCLRRYDRDTDILLGRLYSPVDSATCAFLHVESNSIIREVLFVPMPTPCALALAACFVASTLAASVSEWQGRSIYQACGQPLVLRLVFAYDGSL